MAFTPNPIVCPDDCVTGLPVVSFLDCLPEVSASEINKIFLALSTAASFTDVSSPTEWAKRLSMTNTVPVTTPTNTTVVGDLIRPLTVIADKPAPGSSVKDISNGRQVTLFKTHVINITIDDFSKENADFQRALECGGLFKMWYQTKGGLLFGGNDGILVKINLDMVLGRGDTEVATISGTATWKSKFTEEFTESPLAEAA
jgi:hypothetical protein